jgi:hypothetical protein
MDSWFATQENVEFLVRKKQHFMTAFKDHRLVALSQQTRNNGALYG